MDEFLRTLTGGAGKPRGGQAEPSLGDLLAGLLGGGPETGDDNPLGGALAALLGGGSGGGGNEVAGLAEQAQVTPAIVQAVIALLIGQMGKPGATKGAGPDVAALLEQAGGGTEIDASALKASGLPEQLVKTTGLDLTAAIRVLQKLLPALAGLFNLAGQKPAAKPKPTSSTAAKPKPASSTAAKPRPASSTAAKPKPASSTAAKPKPTSSTAAKPRPASSTAAKPKPASSTAAKPRPASSTAAKPKPASSTAAKPRPRKSDGLLEINLDEPAAEGQ